MGADSPLVLGNQSHATDEEPLLARVGEPLRDVTLIDLYRKVLSALACE